MDKKSKDEPETLKISKSVNIMKGSEAYTDALLLATSQLSM
jgi:hypothetical protein